jgi:hypothetical protein
MSARMCKGRSHGGGLDVWPKAGTCKSGEWQTKFGRAQGEKFLFRATWVTGDIALGSGSWSME